jgi:inorganic pyrophosphatase
MSQAPRPYPYPYGFILGTNGADGDNLDCYLITREGPQAGTIVECEPIGLLEQDEDGEIDHKVLASMPGQDVEAGQALQQELQDFIYSVFRQFPDVHVHVGVLLPREAALDYIQECLEA